ncbi:hypothetical protein OFR22_04120 [Brachyspira hyodysenteriae]|uniref:hypothetical protein n=1 Tax=Brachyspira hyodysenteriae TaxID=159 RepID=UPI0022CD9FF3|nr:hypothetical protein [Brachyspira hyodysenteriae]MCZ9837909.1 hypothetical protein [Brachyspira hyodysenteriae]MCZ9849026.1 hypothetical protein [Brachyspira hyodysenteriae]MCZ9849975.1 hypothetical protein [Brachyspira hyodysenteriae]MCZ9861202.1 hypothetical protein [Brachyspira hyodysenteriae]MCZ9871366.1 hypothetical protein [Brachyspira hyodysenteriae]
MKKNILAIFFIISTVVFAKIEVIKDEFNGTEYYQTDQVDINTWSIDFEYASQIRFRTVNGDSNQIIMDVAVIAPNEVFSLDKILIKYNNDYITTITPLQIYDKVSSRGRNFTYTLSARQSVAFSSVLTEKDIEAIKSKAKILRLEFSDNKFSNIEIKKSEADKINLKLEELLKKVKYAK